MKEIRNNQLELRITPESRLVEGYALVFDSPSNDLGGFIEMIDKNALDGVIEVSDVLCLLNHNEDRGILARCKFGKGSLVLEVDNIGLKYLFEAPQTDLGNELLEGIKRGDITNSSFAFTVAKDKWEKTSDGTYVRTILKIEKLFDVSPVTFPAYNDTTVTLSQRCLDKIEQINSNYYDELRNQIK